jgi:U4/U6.U5 tri-snRNP-associated protein 1
MGEGSEISMSIEETNKLRAKLGLRALDVGEKEEKEGTSNRPIAYMEMVKNEEDEKKSKELQEKVAEMKKIREASKKVLAKKGLGDSSDDEDGLDHAAKWVQRSRKKQAEAAERLARKMQEEEEQAEEQAKAYYNSNSLAGMKLAHEADDFVEGETVVLTLADKRVVTGDRQSYGSKGINEDEDELENVNISEFQKTAVAKARAAVKAKYDGTDESEFNEESIKSALTGQKDTKLLSKYDDFDVEGKRLAGEQQKGLRLGDDGTFDTSKEAQQAAVRAKLAAAAAGKKLESLQTEQKVLESYASINEIAAFKKSKGKVRKLRKKVLAAVRCVLSIPTYAKVLHLHAEHTHTHYAPTPSKHTPAPQHASSLTMQSHGILRKTRR